MSGQHDVRSGRPLTGTRQWWKIRPKVIFSISVGMAFAICAGTKAMLPGDVVMPLVTTAFLLSAAAVRILAWRRGADDPSDVTCVDAAGALVFIGAVTSAATIKPEQLVRLIAS